MRRRSVMAAAATGDGRRAGGGDWRRGGYWQTGPTSVRLRRRESPRAVVGETFGGVGLSPSGPCNLNFQIATTTLCISPSPSPPWRSAITTTITKTPTPTPRTSGCGCCMGGPGNSFFVLFPRGFAQFSFFRPPEVDLMKSHHFCFGDFCDPFNKHALPSDLRLLFLPF